VLKEEAGTELALAIRRAAAGERYINRELASRVALAYMRNRDAD
jgi:DNA-binding NarL/FixJ family response regulator